LIDSDLYPILRQPKNTSISLLVLKTFTLRSIMKTSLPSSKKLFPKIVFISLLSVLILWMLFCFNILYAAGYPLTKFKNSHVAKTGQETGKVSKHSNLVTVPSIAYNNQINYVAGTAIAPITPASSGVATLGYSPSATVLGAGFTTPAGVADDRAAIYFWPIMVITTKAK
jgi:hypothetical protein